MVARFGVATRHGIDIHAMGVRQSAHRKVLRDGQQAVTVCLRFGVTRQVLGVPASEIVDRIVPLEVLWGDTEIRLLCERLAGARDIAAAAALLENAIAERVATTRRSAHVELALCAADRLAHANVDAVADDLGVSARHLRRVFRDAVGVSPKAFARLTRFHRALRAAREGECGSWARIAAAAGYYDQAHLIADFRAIAGVTPRALLTELGGQPLLG
jgi:AraC-like DNA-binding protein